MPIFFEDMLRAIADGAFTEIVRRNTSLVHACVLRRVGGDAQLAEDITQKVFSDLARKAPTLAKLSSVAGWLHVSATLASAEVVRKERRRKAREFEASRLQQFLAPDDTQSSDGWTRIRPLIDGLVCELGSSDREAVVLRFFSKRTYLEIAGVQGTTEDGARKRVRRALEKLRLKLARSGVTSSLEALETVLVKQPDTATPSALANRVASIAILDFGAAGGATSWWLSLARVLTSKAAIAVGVFIAAAILIGLQHKRNALLRAQLDGHEGQPEEVRRLVQDNRRAAQMIAEAENLRRTLASLPAPRSAGISATGGKVMAPLNIEVTSEGQIRWENEHVTLEEFLNRLVASRHEDPASEAPLIVSGEPGAAFSATAYVVEQASKAGFRDIVVNSGALPTARDSWMSVSPVPPAPGDKAPPTLPDVTTKP